MDYTTMSRKQLQETSDEARQELARRQTEDVFFDQLEAMQDQYTEAFGPAHEPGEMWEEQKYALTAYRRGDTVFYKGGRYFISLIPGNMFEPTDRGWRQYNKDGSTRPFVQPEYDHDAYMRGERAINGGFEFEATEDHVMEAPSRQSSQWREVVKDEVEE